MSEIFTVDDIGRNSGWREIEEEKQAYESRRRENEAERERKRKAVVAEKQQPAAPDNWDAWYAAVDARVVQLLEQHFFNGEGKGVGGAVIRAIGDALGEIRQQLCDEFKRAVEEQQRAFEAKLAQQNERFLASNNQATWVSWVDDRINATFGYGRDVMLAEVKDVVEGAQRLIETKLMALEERLRAVPGKLPVARTWCPESVSYQAEFVCHEGALWQACKDTAQMPGGSDWLCVARAGHDAVTPKIRGAYDAHKTYACLDIVECDGAGYLARRDAPGVPGIPGDGWQLMSRSGSRGPAGEVGPRGRKGERGAPGEDAPTIVSWTLDRQNYCAVPTLSNGTQGAVLELHGLFEQLLLDIS